MIQPTNTSILFCPTQTMAEMGPKLVLLDRLHSICRNPRGGGVVVPLWSCDLSDRPKGFNFFVATTRDAGGVAGRLLWQLLGDLTYSSGHC